MNRTTKEVLRAITFLCVFLAIMAPMFVMLWISNATANVYGILIIIGCMALTVAISVVYGERIK